MKPTSETKGQEQEGNEENKKNSQISHYKLCDNDTILTTNQGIRINDDQNSLKAGKRGPTLLEDFIFREKITHFDHERIPERVVHARGSGAHGYFQVYQSLEHLTNAHFLSDPSLKTPVFVRFSTVVGSRGSSDLARDVRGFATKFYTKEGNFDLVGNNIPVFFFQDAIKFPDLVHAIKPEQNSEIPQASSAHNTFWDFISLTPESMHMIMWLMSDRAIPRSFRMMEGFGVHAFRLLNRMGESVFVKFHWKPLMLGVHSVSWDEAQKISGKDPDFHRRDLWEAIEGGAFPEWELGIQIIPEDEELKHGIDILDPTKIIPEELVPVQRIGKMTLNRNPDNFFAETEQVAFHVGNMVPGIDFSDDPLLQGRLFSYLDTQLLRLGGPNFHEIPINRPIVPTHNNQRDGFMRQTINTGVTNYGPNSLGENAPVQALASQGGYVSYPENLNARKVRGKSESFFDHFSQATLFYHSQTLIEKKHIIDAFRFELGKVTHENITKRMLGLLTYVDKNLAAEVGAGLGMAAPSPSPDPILLNKNVPADADLKMYEPRFQKPPIEISASLSMVKPIKFSIKSRVIAFLVDNNVDITSLQRMQTALEAQLAKVIVVAPQLGIIRGENGREIKANKSLSTAASVLFDAVYIPGGGNVQTLLSNPYAISFVEESFLHCKPIAVDAESLKLLHGFLLGAQLLNEKFDAASLASLGIIIGKGAEKYAAPHDFIDAIAHHRFWEREMRINGS